MATSPGARGGLSVLETAIYTAPFFKGEVKGSFSLPNFYDNFDIKKGCIVNKEKNQELLEVLKKL
jgi:hypothetical protein